MKLGDCQCDKPECPECGPLLALAEQIRREFEHAQTHARLPTAEIVWWRAQMRAREEAARTAARPIVFSQALALAALVGLLVSVLGRLSLPVMSWSGFQFQTGLSLIAIAAAAACALIIAPAALYYAFSRD